KMSTLEQELDVNYAAFRADWNASATDNWAALGGHRAYAESYRRLCCLQTIKNELVIPNFSGASAAFFSKGHNDALVSHVNASFGAWRSSLQALRSCLENVLCAIYYKDHPIELELWTTGRFRIGFTELHRYLVSHPMLTGVNTGVTGLDLLDEEYATLSKAVHASAANFRMTDAASTILLWSKEPARIGMWATRERKLLEALSLLMICLYREKLQGTMLTSLRNMLYFTVSPKKRALVKSDLHITILKS